MQTAPNRCIKGVGASHGRGGGFHAWACLEWIEHPPCSASPGTGAELPGPQVPPSDPR